MPCLSFSWSRSAYRVRLLFFVTLMIAGTLFADRPGEWGRGVPEVKELTEADALERIEQFRSQRLLGDYTFDFVLKDMPRRGQTQVFNGTLWGRWKNGQPRFRLQMTYPAQSQQSLGLIVHSAERPQAWFSEDGELFTKMRAHQLYQPLVPELDYSIFDLSMAFIYWKRFEYEGSERVRGQPAHIFKMYPPSDIPADIAYVRVTLHANYNALIKADIYNRNDELVKGLNILSFKKVQEQWIVRSLDYTNEQTRDKSRFTVMRAALDTRLPQDYFEPTWTGGLLMPRADYWEVIQ